MDGAADIPLRIPLGTGIPLVVLGFTLAQTKLELHPPILQIDLQGDERVALPGDQTVQLADLLLVQQQLLLPQRQRQVRLLPVR